MTLTATTSERPAVVLAQRASRLFAASFAAFLGVLLTMIVGLSERQSATGALAEEYGGAESDIPAPVYAAALDETNTPLAYAAIALLALVSVTLFVLGCRSLNRVARRERDPMARVAVALPVVGLASFWALLVAEQLLARRQPWMVEHFWTVWQSTLAVFIMSLALAVVLVVACLWPTGLARRTSVVVALLATLVALVTMTAGVPPILPILLAAVLAFNVSRAAARAG